MTSQPQPVPGEGTSAGQILRDLRDVGAYALVGVPAVLLFVAIIRLIPDSGLSFGLRSQSSFYGFVNLETVFLPLAAVLLALLVRPVHPKARLIVIAALVEYAVAAFFGVFVGLLVGLINTAADNGARAAFEELLLRVAWLALLAVPAYAVLRIWQSHYPPAHPKPAPPQSGVYGHPQHQAAGGYPAQPGYGPPPGQPYYPPGPPAPPPGYGPTTYGQPADPSWNPPPMYPPAGPAFPGSGQPAPNAAPPAPGPYADPTQVMPPTGTPDHTQVVPPYRDRPGFGPAEPDPPRH